MIGDKQQTVPNILFTLAHFLGTEVKGRRLDIPPAYGSGYCVGYIFNEDIRLMISQYELKEDILVENPEIDVHTNRILFKFQHIIPDTTAMPSVLIATSRMNSDALIPIHTNTATINIEVEADYLNRLFALSDKSPVLESLLQNTQPLLFEQLVYPSLQRIVDEIVNTPVDEAFELFLLRIKAEELVCRLLMELEKRDEQHLYPLNNQDIQALYNVKEYMLVQLHTPPSITDLASRAGMSPSKLKRLFKQIFGNSLFNYYQTFRMKEAARLLKEEKRSVSDTGYSLGFTNLSHFSRVFEAHIGMKPKQYSRTTNELF